MIFFQQTYKIMPILYPLILLVAIFFILKVFLGKNKESVVIDDLFTGGDSQFGAPEYGTPTINKSKAKAISISLYNEMNASFFSSEAVIMDFINGLNEADYLLVYNEFGRVPYSKVTNNNHPLAPNKTTLDLTGWLTYEITSTKNKNKLKDQFPNFF